MHQSHSTAKKKETGMPSPTVTEGPTVLSVTLPDPYPQWQRTASAALGIDVVHVAALFDAGYQAGWQACDDELAALQREAVRRVRIVNGLPAEPRKRVA